MPYRTTKFRWKWGDRAKKRELFVRGVDQCTRFLTVNGLPELRFKARQLLKGRYAHYSKAARRVDVSLFHCRAPVIQPGLRAGRSYPGALIDATPVGICAGWTALHLLNTLDLERWVVNWSAEPLVRGYERTSQDDFCSTLRLFITNPDLLRVGRPVRWYSLTRRFGWIPVETRSWEEVLRGAPRSIRTSAYVWIRRGVEEVYRTLNT